MPATSQSSAPSSSITWTDERIERLKVQFAAGLSCREIAAEIGVSRNAVIGKLSRLNLTRGPKRSEPKRNTRETRTVPRLQYRMLAAIYGEEEGAVEPAAIDESNRCSLLDLTGSRCRWPISTPGTDDFCFCGNDSPDGQPYCTGHARLAYMPGSRARRARF